MASSTTGFCRATNHGPALSPQLRFPTHSLSIYIEGPASPMPPKRPEAAGLPYRQLASTASFLGSLRRWGAVLGSWCGILLLLGGGSVALAAVVGLYSHDGPTALRDLFLIGQTTLINAAVLMCVLDLRERTCRHRDAIARREETLRSLSKWSAEEGLLRKTGLIRDLNALGAVPHDLQQMVLVGADLDGVDLSGAVLREANLRGARLQGAKLNTTDFWGADLTGADLSRASLVGANLRGCSLRNARLTKADLDGANLHRADLVNANVEGVQLETTHLAKARFADGPADRFSGPITSTAVAYKHPPSRTTDQRFHSAIHPSLEDWVRARLDEQGCYAGEVPPQATEYQVREGNDHGGTAAPGKPT